MDYPILTWMIFLPLVGMVAIMHARPEINLPTHGPAGGTVAALGEGGAAGLGQIRCMRWANLASGMHTSFLMLPVRRLENKDCLRLV